ncbi:MAG: response regulator transcription factor [Verrucomicrobiota bacterium]
MNILIVEDDTHIRNGLVQLLNEEGYKVDAFSNGEEGLYQASEWDYDLVILDVMLPKLDGWEITKKLRAKQKSIPILMLTALSEIDDVVTGLNLGADDFMTKPYNERELLARVRSLARRGKGTPSDEIQLGRVVVNTLQRAVFADEAEISLTATEYRIVEYLALRAGQVVPHGQLLDVVTGDTEEPESNVIDVHIYRIRRKLGKNFLNNKRGLGYIIPSPQEGI